MGDFDLDFYKNVLKYSTLPNISEETSAQSDNSLKWVEYKVAGEIVSNGSTENIDTIQQKWINKMKDNLKVEKWQEEYDDRIKESEKPPIQEEVIVQDEPTLPPKEIVEPEPAWKPPLETIDTIVDNTEGIVYKELQQESRQLIASEPEKVATIPTNNGEGQPVPPETNDIYAGQTMNVYFILFILIFIFLIK